MLWTHKKLYMRYAYTCHLIQYYLWIIFQYILKNVHKPLVRIWLLYMTSTAGMEATLSLKKLPSRSGSNSTVHTLDTLKYLTCSWFSLPVCRVPRICTFGTIPIVPIYHATPLRLLEKHSSWSWLRECQECEKPWNE